MVFWKSLEQRCLETATSKESSIYLSNASGILGPVQLSGLINWLTAHDCLSDVNDDRIQAAIQGLCCDEIRSLDLYIGDVDSDFLMALASKCGSTLDFLRLECGFKVFDDSLSILLQSLLNIRYVDIRDWKADSNNGFLSQLQSSKLKGISLQLYIRDTSWNEMETLVEQNPCLESIRYKIKGRTLHNEDALLTKISDHLASPLVELELQSFTASKEALSHLFLTCRALKILRFTGSLHFSVDTMRQVQRDCNWEIFDVTFQVTPTRETHQALQYLPRSLKEIALDFGPSPQTTQANEAIISLLSSLPALKRIRYHSRSFNDTWMNNLLITLDENVVRNLECLDLGLCDSVTDTGLESVADRCWNLQEFYLHSDTSRYNKVATCLPLCRWFDHPIDEARNLRVLYLNYFKQLSSDFLQVMAVECANLEEIHLASVRCVNNGLLKFFADHCPKLHTIDVMNCWAVEDRGIIGLAEKLHLINLNVAMCLKLTNESVYALAKCCPYLERFIYHGVPNLKRSPAVKVLQGSCIKRLKTYWYQWPNTGTLVL